MSTSVPKYHDASMKVCHNTLASRYHVRWLTLLHSERPKCHTVLAFLSAIGLKVHSGEDSTSTKDIY